MAEHEIISYDEAYARTEAIFDELSLALPGGISREVFLQIVAEAALSRLKRKARSAANLGSQIRFLARLLIDEAACSPLDAMLLINIAALNDASEQQFARAFDEDRSERQGEFSLNFVNKITLTLTKVSETRARSAALRRIDGKEGVLDIADALAEGRRRLEAARARHASGDNSDKPKPLINQMALSAQPFSARGGDGE